MLKDKLNIMKRRPTKMSKDTEVLLAKENYY
jgi:hypothetical protein